MVDARTTIHGNRLGLGALGNLILDGQTLFTTDSSTKATAVEAITAGTSAATFGNGGITTFGTTAAGAYILAAPTAGVRKWLVKSIGSSLTETVTTSGATIHDQYSATTVNTTLVNTINFVGSTIFNVGQAIQLLGISTSKWVVVSKNSTVMTVTS